MVNKEEEVNKNIKSGRGHLEKIFALADENRKLTLGFFALIILVVYLGLALVKIKQQMVLSVDIPEKAYFSGKAQVATDRANKLFYKLWGAYLVRDVLGNYTHRTIRKKYEYLLKSLSDEKVATYGPSIRDKVKKTITQLTTHTYSESKVMTKGDKYSFTYISYGKGIKKVGELEEFIESCEYQIDMSVKDFRMKIDRVYEKCKREKK